MYSRNFVIGIYGPKSIQKHITVETEAAPYEITIGLLEICSLGHRRQIWHNHRKVDVWDDIWTSYRDLVLLKMARVKKFNLLVPVVPISGLVVANAIPI